MKILLQSLLCFHSFFGVGIGIVS